RREDEVLVRDVVRFGARCRDAQAVDAPFARSVAATALARGQRRRLYLAEIAWCSDGDAPPGDELGAVRKDEARFAPWRECHPHVEAVFHFGWRDDGGIGRRSQRLDRRIEQGDHAPLAEKERE